MRGAGASGETCCSNNTCSSSSSACFLVDGGTEGTCECNGGNCTPTTVATGTTVVEGIAVDSTYVYWTENNGSIKRAPKGGGGPIDTLYTSASSASPIAINSNNIVFAGSSSFDVYSMPIAGLADGGSPTWLGRVTAGSGTPSVVDVVIDTSNAYTTLYTLQPPAPAQLIPLTGLPDGGSPTDLGYSSGHLASHIRIDDTCAYWSATYAVNAGPLTGGGGTTIGDVDASAFLANATYPVPFAIDACHVYSYDRTNIVQVPKAGGAATILATPPNQVTQMAVDASTLYWTEIVFSAWYLRAMPLTGGPPVTLSTAAFAGPVMQALVLDSGYIYWSVNSTIMRLAK